MDPQPPGKVGLAVWVSRSQYIEAQNLFQFLIPNSPLHMPPEGCCRATVSPVGTSCRRKHSCLCPANLRDGFVDASVLYLQSDETETERQKKPLLPTDRQGRSNIRHLPSKALLHPIQDPFSAPLRPTTPITSEHYLSSKRTSDFQVHEPNQALSAHGPPSGGCSLSRVSVLSCPRKILLLSSPRYPLLLLGFINSSTAQLNQPSPSSPDCRSCNPISTPSYTMAARMIAPKVASLMGSTSSKLARPVVRSSLKANLVSQRAFSGMCSSHPSSSSQSLFEYPN